MAGNATDKVEQYARILFDAGVSAGRAGADLVQWRHAVKFSPEVLSTISTLQESGDANLVGRVHDRLTQLIDEDDSTVVATVTTAVKMDDDLRRAVVSKCEELFSAEVYLVERIDPAIVGGIVIEGRGERFDSSVRTRLAVVRRELSSTFLGGGHQ